MIYLNIFIIQKNNMLEILFLIVAFIGSVAAGLYDLKTTEIPDEIPYTMMAVGIIGGMIKSYLAWSYMPLLLSFTVGLGFLGFGLIMYYTGQWGGGDAKILSGIGFLVPTLPSGVSKTLFFPFSLSFFFNLFLVGAIYMIVYALILSIINRKIWTAFFKNVRANVKTLLIFDFSLILFFILIGFAFTKLFNFTISDDLLNLNLTLVLLCTGMFLLWKFVKVVEEVGFKKKIPVSQLKIGDVPLDFKVWEGVTEKDLAKIKKSGKKYIWIKEGVRFAPAFPLALLFTIFYGDIILLLINYGTSI
jgi:preflagellin peptidase FlaK